MQQCLHWIIVSAICSVLQTSKVHINAVCLLKKCSVFVKEISEILANISVDILLICWIQDFFLVFSANNLSFFCVWVCLFVLDPVLYCSYCPV